jgi:hypothetical protein
MEKPKLYKACFKFTQEGNYNGTTQDIEELSIHCENSGDGFFFVLETETGWSVDDVKELQELFAKVENSLAQLENKSLETNSEKQ